MDMKITISDELNQILSRVATARQDESWTVNDEINDILSRFFGIPYADVGEFDDLANIDVVKLTTLIDQLDIVTLSLEQTAQDTPTRENWMAVQEVHTAIRALWSARAMVALGLCFSTIEETEQ